MSLAKPTTAAIIKKQYTYKLKAYLNVYFYLVILQIISIIFSISATNSVISGISNMDIKVSYYSVDIVIIFTMIWAFITAILLTTKTYRYNDFGFVANRLSSNVSNVLFLLTASIIGGTTAMISTFLQKDLLYYIGGVTFLTDSSSLLFFSLKISIVIFLLFTCATVISNRLEVRS